MILRKVFSFATLTLLVALTLSAIAAWYSILGLTAIFAAAVIPIIIMGGALEFAKVVTTVWLHRYWHRASWKLKLYLIPAVMALAFLTSMGIFGFLSKAHSDQTLVSGDVAAKVELIDEKIKIARDNIAMNQKALQQMDSQVDQLLGRTTDDTGANRAVQVRRQQAAERNRLNNEIATEQAAIAKLNEEAAPIRAEIRKVEAEVGPIKYIAAMIYGDNPDANLLERAVRWVIILIVFVFDPLALVLVLAAQSSYKWLDDDLRNRKKEEEEEDKFKENFLSSKGTVDPDIDLGFKEEPQPLKSLNDEYGDADEVEKMLEEALVDILNDSPYDVEENTGDKVVQQDIVEPDAMVGNNELETHASDANEPLEDLERSKEEVKGDSGRESRSSKPQSEIKTEGVTIQESDGGYVQYDGKSVSKDALKGMHPELFLQVDSGSSINTSFGIEFPKFAKKGDTFVRVDTLPNRVFKFSGTKWIEINKEQTDSYLYDEEYIKYLVNKIETGEYDIELLTENEKLQIEDYLLQNKPLNK